MGKNVAVFVDVANIFYAAKAAGVDVDYVDLLKHASSGRDLVRAYAYTGLDPDNENQRNFHSFLARHGYKVVSKDIRKYGDGKVKANLDIELVVDMMKTARNLDIAIVVSGDGDFAPAIRAVQEMGVRVEVISFKGNTSSDLIEVADLFTDITKVASSDRTAVRERAADEADLSMTVVPEKESEGSGRGRGGRGGRSRTRTGEPARAAEPRRAAATREPARGRGRARPVVEEVEAEEIAVGAVGGVVVGPGGALVALPGERLSKAPRVAAAQAVQSEAPVEELEVDDLEDITEAEPGEDDAAGGDLTADGKPRRRRRRGGRGRGRGREAGAVEGEVLVGPEDLAEIETIRLEEDEEEVPEPAPRRHATFGSVWDSQLGMAGGPTGGAPHMSTPSIEPEELDEDEPAIPEYLIAERRQGQGGRGGQGGRSGGRGGQGGARAGYSAAVDRERYGNRSGGRGPEPSRGGRPVGTGSGGSGGSGQPSRPPMRQDRVERQDRPERSGEAFSDVPPELEAMLRAQIAARPQGRIDADRAAETRRARPAAEAGAATGRGRGRGRSGSTGDAPIEVREPAVTPMPVPDAGEKPARGRGRTRAAAPAEAPVTTSSAPARASRSRKAAGAAPEAAPAAEAAPRRATRSRKADGSAPATGTEATPAAKRARSTRPASEVPTGSEAPAGAPAPKRTARAKKAADGVG